MITGRYKVTGTKNGKVVSSVSWVENLVMLDDNVGLNLLLQALADDPTNPPAITKAKMGTGTTAPTDTDTDLETPTVDDILVATRTLTATTLSIKFFASDADVPDDTYTEFGLFCGDQIFARSIITPDYVKGSGVDTTVEYELTASNA